MTDFPVLEEFGRQEFGVDPTAAYQAAHAYSDHGLFSMPSGDGLLFTAYQTLDKLKTHPALQAQNRAQRVSGSGTVGALAKMSLAGPFFVNEPLHTPLARAVYAPISPRRNHPLIEQITELAEDAMAALVRRGEGDLVKDYAFEIASRFWLQFLGLPSSMQTKFAEWSGAIVPMLRFTVTEQAVNAANTAVQELWEFLIHHYQQIKDSDQETLFHLLAPGLAACEVSGAPENPADTIGAITFDGIDSVTGATANVLYRFVVHLDQQKLLREDLSLLRAAWREAVRIEPALIGLHRAATQPIDYHGVTIPKDVNIFMAWGCANRDPRVFDNPDRFDILRSQNKPLTFGGGSRICKGRHLAMLQGEIALRVMLEQTRQIELATDSVEWGPPGMIRTPKAIPVRLVPR